MSEHIPKQILLMVVVALILASVGTSVVSAAVSLQVDTEYEGASAESLAIQTTITLSPEESRITDVVITIDETNRGFVDFDSFERSFSPGNADVNISYTGSGEFRVQELTPQQRMTITFMTYPRTIDEPSLDVATVDVEYVQQGQTLTEERTVTADLSDSEAFELESAQNRIQQMQLLTYGGVAAIVLLILVLGGIAYKSLTDDDDDGPFGGGGDNDPF